MHFSKNQIKEMVEGRKMKLMVETSMKEAPGDKMMQVPQPPPFFLWETALEHRLWHQINLELNPHSDTQELYRFLTCKTRRDNFTDLGP